MGDGNKKSQAHGTDEGSGSAGSRPYAGQNTRETNAVLHSPQHPRRAGNQAL